MAPKIVNKPENFTLNVGDDINITCLITGIPAPKVTWYHGQTTVRADARRYRVETTNESTTLTVAKATVKDSAEFTLKLQNDAGSDKGSVKVDVVGTCFEQARDRLMTP